MTPMVALANTSAAMVVTSIAASSQNWQRPEGRAVMDRRVEWSALGEDLAQLRGEGIGVAGLAVLATEEAAVVAREDHRIRAEALGDGDGAAVRHRRPDSTPAAITIRVDAARSASKSGS